MLILTRQRDQSILIGNNVKVTVTDIRGDKVRLGITAPDDIVIDREEVRVAKEEEARMARNPRRS